MALPRKILFISYDGMTDPLGQSQVIPYMQGMAKAGYEVTILSCEKPATYNERKIAVEEVLNNAGIKWVPLRYTKNPPILSGLYDLYKLKNTARKIHKKQKIDLVHTRAGTPAMVGLWMKKKYGVKFLNDVRDFFADSRVDAGQWNKQSLIYGTIYRLFKKKEKEAIKKSDGIVCLTYAAEKIIKQWPQYNNKIPLSVIPCCVDLDLFNPANITIDEQTKCRRELGIDEKDEVFSYLGSIGGWYLVDEMMKFFRLLLQKNPKAKFLFISPHQHEYITQTAVKYGIPSDKVVSVKGFRPQIPLLLSLSKYSVFFIKPCYSKQASSPTKHAELMAMSIPVITNSGVGDMKQIVEKYKSGFVADNFSEETFNQLIEKLDTKVFDDGVIRSGAADFYALDKAIEKYLAIYQMILT